MTAEISEFVDASKITSALRVFPTRFFDLPLNAPCQPLHITLPISRRILLQLSEISNGAVSMTRTD